MFINDDLLEQAKKDYLSFARTLNPRYEDWDITDLLNKYVRAVDRHNRYEKSLYFSALMLRFWYRIRKLATENANISNDVMLFHDWLVDAIQLACDYRGWTKKKKHLTGQTAINQCIATIRVRYYYQINLQKHKATQCLSYATSLDQPIGDNDKTTYGDLLAVDNSAEEEKEKLNIYTILQHCLDHNRVIETMILDCLRSNDCTRRIKIRDKKTKKVRYKLEIWKHKAVEMLNDLPQEYLNQFINTYNVEPRIAAVAFNTLLNAKISNKYKYIEKAIEVFKRYAGEEA